MVRKSAFSRNFAVDVIISTQLDCRHRKQMCAIQNVYLSLLSQVLGITRIGHELAEFGDNATEWDIGSWC